MNSRDRSEFGTEVSELLDTLTDENDRSTKLGRRRLIEDLNEQRMLEAELSDYEMA
ncbi:MAG: hypothetical protein JJT82_02300 [Legionellaceae bacterium]|nr:hypothetical protein [Legionellaceae bacterium]